MSKKLFILSMFVAFSGSVLADGGACCVRKVPTKTFASINAEWNSFRPNCLYYQRAGVPDWNSFGMNFGLMRAQKGSWSMQPVIGFTYGAINYNNLVENVELSKQQTGTYNARSHRTSGFGGLQFGRLMGKSGKFALEIPVMFSIRNIGHKGYFIGDDNRVVEGDLSGNNTFNGKFDSRTQFGFKSGLEAVLFPSGVVSFYTRFNFTYFARKDVFNVAETSLNQSSGNVEVPFESVKATGNYGWAVGIRFNLLWPSSCKR